MNPNIIVFRVDASLEIGTGHVMRCLTLAESLRERGCECHFICREHRGNLNDLISERGFNLYILSATDVAQGLEQELDAPAHAAWLGTDWRTDMDEVRSFISKMTVDWIVVDHYAIDEKWERALRPNCRKLMVIDDLADRKHDCDLLLDQNLIKDWRDRYQGKVPENCALLLCPKYALLNPIYAELHNRIPPRDGPVRRILVYFGGADHDNMTGMVITAFESLQCDDIMLDVVVNPSSPHSKSIQRQAAQNKQICLHGYLPNLSSLMVQADLAVGAGGATSWERCCLGLPSLVITLAENQRPIAEELGSVGLVRYLGNKDVVDKTKVARELLKILELGISADWSARCSMLVDGKGVDRVADILLLNAKTLLRSRLARIDDKKILLNWASDPVDLNYSLDIQKVDSTINHKLFYDSMRDIENCRLFILETEKGFPVGQVRFDQTSSGWVAAYSLDSCARGHGLDALLLETAMMTLRKSTNHVLHFAQLKDTTKQSRNKLEKLDFVQNIRGGELSIAVCSDASSWINTSIPKLILDWLFAGHSVAWSHDADELHGGDFCFYLSYGKIVDVDKRSRYRHNLVVHESNLPKGRGWSPMTWQILEGRNRIPVTLLEAVDAVDAGPIYLQDWIDFKGHELIDELRDAQADVTINLCRRFVLEYPTIVYQSREQTGIASFYPRRRPEHSRLNPEKTILEQFNLLRVVDNERYPAFFKIKNSVYVFKIEKI